MRVIRRAGVLVVLVLALLPASAVAAYIRSYNVRDAGDRIVHRIRWCLQRQDVRPGYELKATWAVEHQTDQYSDWDRVHFDGAWYSRGCWTTRLSYRDYLRYEAWYIGRVRLNLGGGETVTTQRKPFYVE